MDDRRMPRWAILAAMLVVGYLSFYAALRARHTLVRTALFTGAADSAVFTTDGRWVHNDIVAGPVGVASHHWGEWVFAPMIFAESNFWDTVGRHLSPPTP